MNITALSNHKPGVLNNYIRIFSHMLTLLQHQYSQTINVWQIIINEYHLCWSHYFERFTVVTMTWLTVIEYLCHKWSRLFLHSWFITGFVTGKTWRVSHVEQELIILPVGSCCFIFSFICNVLYTASDYHFGIFKLFLYYQYMLGIYVLSYGIHLMSSKYQCLNF